MKHVLIDTDAGVDDALAILLALSSRELAIEGIATVAGNIDVEHATANVLTILDAVFPPIRPSVARGAERPLNRPLVTAAHVHGEDGLGNITTLRRPDGSPKYPSSRHGLVSLGAAEFIIDEVRKHGPGLTLITLGPLTNVAEAIRLNPETMRRVGEIIIMGGAFRTYGNTSPVAEFNIFVDPDAAARIVEFDVPKTVVPLDVTEQVILTRTELECRYASNPSPILDFTRDVSSFYMDFHRDNDGFDGCYMHDPTTVAFAIDRSVLMTVPAEVHVECKGEYTAGMTVADLRPERAGRYRTNTEVAVGVDAGRVIDLFFSRLLAC
ncbi:MAG: nucleoside hydrolase [Armatimonadota bacterium]|nr:nucleoside hydrolase [Armatimonadota bacterium]